ncbi:KN motif and ankyrin repeat domain-containing protein 2 [Amia ocellicauda]|uniref:KN motif and ankyrin repeat domain-containing protein 2 n=1 Tax=Amia ocellicauda TaxID=2972642 RepID=UPI00346471A1
MAQVLHMDPSFPGKSNPTSPTALHGKEPELPYSVETPYGYRLDLDFLKYVNDIEKGNTIKKVPIHRRPRYNSLPRGYGYTGSWWTSTESLCSNASMDSRHSSFSYCAPGYYGSHRPESGRTSLGPSGLGFNARVERTLLDARKKLEEDQKDGRRFSQLGSMHSSVTGSTSSLAGQGYSRGQNGAQAGGGGGQFTPMSSGLSTPVSPTPAHLQHVREQMVVALRKIRELEEQVKMIPVLQVKISVLQEEKRQLSVQLKSQKFLGHTMGFGKSRPRGELYIDIPEEAEARAGAGGGAGGGALSPTAAESCRQDSGCEIEDTVIVGGARLQTGGRKEVRSIGTGAEGVEGSAEKPVRHIGVAVQEQDLGAQSAEAWKSKVGLLESQLRKAQQELHCAHRKLVLQGKQTAEKGQDAKPSMADAVMMTSVGWQELQAGRPGDASGLQTVVSFNQQPQRREQRTVGIQVYTLEQPTVVRSYQDASGGARKVQAEFVQQPMPAHASLSCTPLQEPCGRLGGPETALTVAHRREEPLETSFPVHPEARQRKAAGSEGEAGSVEAAGAAVLESSPELPIAICSKEVREVLQKSEVSSSVPVCSPAVVLETVSATQLVSSQLAPLCQRLKEADAAAQMHPEAAAAAEEESTSQPASPQSGLKSIMKSKDSEGRADSPNTKKNLQFIGVNGGYESTSSSESSSESSEDGESSESEYHEANERLPEARAAATQSAPPAVPGQGSSVAPPEPQPQPEDITPTPTPTPTPPPATAPAPTAEQGLSEGAAGESAPETQSQEIRLELSDSFMSACRTLQTALGEPSAFSQQGVRTAYTTVLQEWLRISCHKAADPEAVRQYMALFRSVSPQLLEFIVNMADGNGNTALHYTVSHSNFPVVRLLLDTGLCNADKQNKAGYTAIMLTALAAFHSDSDLDTVTQLLRTGDVNAKASQAGQTALMLAVSHGRGDMVGALLACGASVNVQDDDGSTALMCACEHGHVDIVKQLLAVPGCDATLTDNDGSTALSIALEANQNDIAVLLYAHLNFAKPPSPVTQKALHLGTAPPPAEAK